MSGGRFEKSSFLHFMPIFAAKFLPHCPIMVTFETKVYEKDWRYILQGDYLDQIIRRCHYPFKEKVLFINNVDNKEMVIQYAEEKVQSGVLDRYYLVEDYADEALKHFGIDKESFKGGYYYSIAELVSIYLCQTEFLLHFSSDAFMQKNGESWIEESKNILRTREDILVANPSWNFQYDQAKDESMTEIGSFYVGYGFSDQCYLVRADRFKKSIFNESHPDSERYPKYGGELFEKRVDSYMRNNGLFRISSQKVSYIHKNFKKNHLLSHSRILSRILAIRRLKTDGGRK
jgi:hypothetical protein